MLIAKCTQKITFYAYLNCAIRKTARNYGELINTTIAGRDYQIRAIRSVLEAIEQKKRDFLQFIVTGTGKTRT